MERLRLITFSRPLSLLAAEACGCFAAEGLEVACEITRGSVEQIRGLLAGRWDVAHTAADNVMAYVDRESADLGAFFVADLGIDQNLVVVPDVEDYEQLRGRRLVVDAPDTGYAFVLRRMLALHGLAEGDYELVSVGNTQQRLEAMQAGRAAAGLLSDQLEWRALQSGLRHLDEASRYLPRYPGLTAAAAGAWRRSHEAEVAAYARALAAGARWAADPAHRDEGIGLIARDRGVDAATAQRLYAGEAIVRKGRLPSLDEVREALGVVRDLRRDMTGVGHELTAYFDDRLMRQVLAGGPAAGGGAAGDRGGNA